MHACMHLCMYVCMYACRYVCMHACMHAYLYLCMHACMYDLCMYVCMHCMYVCMHACMRASMHVCISLSGRVYASSSAPNCESCHRLGCIPRSMPSLSLSLSLSLSITHSRRVSKRTNPPAPPRACATLSPLSPAFTPRPPLSSLSQVRICVLSYTYMRSLIHAYAFSHIRTCILS